MGILSARQEKCRLVSLDCLESSPEPLVKLGEIPRVSQNRLDKGFEENPFCESRPTSAVNDFDQFRVVLVARKIGNCLFHFAEFSLESLNLIRRRFGLRL
jgi:hypothetical protein